MTSTTTLAAEVSRSLARKGLVPPMKSMTACWPCMAWSSLVVADVAVEDLHAGREVMFFALFGLFVGELVDEDGEGVAGGEGFFYDELAGLAACADDEKLSWCLLLSGLDAEATASAALVAGGALFWLRVGFAWRCGSSARLSVSEGEAKQTMLLELRAENYAVIDRAEAQFGRGLNLLTGETGAGKSILIDALALLLGGKASADSIRHGAEKAVVSCLFEATPGALAVLTENGIDADSESDGVLLRRGDFSCGQGAGVYQQPAGDGGGASAAGAGACAGACAGRNAGGL